MPPDCRHPFLRGFCFTVIKLCGIRYCTQSFKSLLDIEEKVIKLYTRCPVKWCELCLKWFRWLSLWNLGTIVVPEFVLVAMVKHTSTKAIRVESSRRRLMLRVVYLWNGLANGSLYFLQCMNVFYGNLDGWWKKNRLK